MDGGTLTAATVSLGALSPMGTLEVSSGTVTVNGPGGIAAGGFGGNGVIALNPSSNLTLTNGTLAWARIAAQACSRPRGI